jgi:hypothetical protein
MGQTLQIDKTETIVVTNSIYRLKRFLRRGRNDRGYYICFSSPSPSLTALLAEHDGTQPLTSVFSSPSRQEAILHDYIEAIGQLGEWNGHIPHWWMTDIASKNAYRSPLLKPLHELVHCLDAIQTVRGSNSRLFIIDPSWPTVMAIKHLALHNKCDLRILSWPWSRIFAKWSGKTKAWAEMFRSAVGTIREIARTKKYYGNKFIATKEREPIYLIKSFVYPYSFKDDGSYQDPFFGKLADHLAEQLAGKVKVITIALGFTLKRYCYEKMKTLKGSMVIPFESMLRYTDVIKGFCHLSWMLISKPFQVREKVEFLGHDIADLLRELLTSGGWRIPFDQYIHCSAGERLAKNYRLVACALTHENNPWERAFIAGIRQINPDTRIIGYQHSVIPQASANMFQSQREMSKIPAPDVVLTTGAVPANILRKYGSFPEERIKVSCGLRYNYLDEMQPQSRHRSGNHEKTRILVALCGVIETLPLVRYAIGQARSHQHVEFLMRAHPVLPFEKLQLLIDDTNVLPANMRISRGSSVMEDILECDAVLYWGSSVALEGIRLGKPAIHFNQDDILSYDPLFDLADFKWVISSQDDIMDLFDKIRIMPDNKFEELQARARHYVIEYHNPVSKESLSPFLAF